MENMQTEESQKVVRNRFIRQPIGYLYADISLEFESKHVDLDERAFKLQLMVSLKSIYGDNGASIQMDILKFNNSKHRAFIRFEARYLTQVRTALSLTRCIENRKCAILINKICHSLSSLPLDQTVVKHNIICSC